MKMSTGVAGLDAMLRGGLPRGRTTLLHGETGTGKTMLGMHFLLAGVREEEPGVLLSFEERADALRMNAATLGWDLAGPEREGRLAILETRIDPQAVVAGQYDFSGLYAVLEGVLSKLCAKRIVLDAVDVLLSMLNDPVRERNELYRLHDWLLERGVSTLLTMRMTGDYAYYSFVEFMTDCVLRLRAEREGRERTLQVVKYRGSAFSGYPQPYAMGERGFIVHPLTQLNLNYPVVLHRLPTGLPDLDDMLGGGYPAGAATVIAGASGTGKTTFVSTFAAAACGRGEPTLYVNYEESSERIVAAMRSPGVDLQPALDNGLLSILSPMPEAVSTEVHLDALFGSLRRHRAAHVILDAVSAASRMHPGNGAFFFLLRVLHYCRTEGISVILTNQLGGGERMDNAFGMGYSSLVDTIVHLDYVPVGGEVNRTLLVMKSRGSTHTNQYREFFISSHGIRFVPVYPGRGGMLTGVARQEEEMREEREKREREHRIASKRKELERLQALLEAEVTARNALISKERMELQNMEREMNATDQARAQRGRMRGKSET